MVWIELDCVRAFLSAFVWQGVVRQDNEPVSFDKRISVRQMVLISWVVDDVA